MQRRKYSKTDTAMRALCGTAIIKLDLSHKNINREVSEITIQNKKPAHFYGHQ